VADQSTYPTISEKNWWTIRDKFKSSLPATISPNFIKTLLTLSSESSAINNVLLPMKRLGLIDETNKPTQLANDWRLDEKYKVTCQAMISSIYSQELLDLFPEENVDRNIAVNWFMGNGVGSSAAGKMTALFILLKSGEIPGKQERKTPATKKPTSKAKPSSKAKETEVFVSESTSTIDKSESAPINASNNNSVSRPNLHIDLQIHISPESSPEQIEAIFASMAKHLYGVDNS